MLKAKLTYKTLIFIFILLTLLTVSFLSFSSLKRYNTPTLVGEWRSLETKEVIIFTDDGLVKFKNTTKAGSYIILSPTKMEYTIDDKTFIMNYYLEERKLSWGVDDDTLELFSKTPILSL